MSWKRQSDDDIAIRLTREQSRGINIITIMPLVFLVASFVYDFLTGKSEISFVELLDRILSSSLIFLLFGHLMKSSYWLFLFLRSKNSSFNPLALIFDEEKYKRIWYVILALMFIGLMAKDWSIVKQQKVLSALPVVGTVLITYLFLRIWMRYYRKKRFKKKVSIYASSYTDSPISFSYKVSWLAIPTNNTEKLLRQLSKKGFGISSNWEKGMKATYHDFCFISPPVKGWSLVINPPSPFDNIYEGNKRKDILKLSKLFGEVQQFGSHRVSSFTMWARYVNGGLTRGHMCSDGIYTSEGVMDAFEEKIYDKLVSSLLEDGMDEDEINAMNQEEILGGDEDMPLRIAEVWSKNPQKLDEIKEKSDSLGFLIPA